MSRARRMRLACAPPPPSCTATSKARSTGLAILLVLRDLQAETGGFTEFVPLPFVHMEAPMYLRGLARKGPTLREAILMHSVARLALHPLITNIQTSWVKMGPEGAALCLNAGANDMGGTLMNESISRAAGTQHGQEFPPEAMEGLIAWHRPRAGDARHGLSPGRQRTAGAVVRRAGTGAGGADAAAEGAGGGVTRLISLRRGSGCHTLFRRREIDALIQLGDRNFDADLRQHECFARHQRRDGPASRPPVCRFENCQAHAR